MKDALTTITQYIVEGRCALFVGPDLSESAGGFRGLPTSWQLADELAASCHYRGRYRPLPQMAQIFAREKGESALKQYLLERLGASEFHPLPVHELIARIPFRVIVSAGWDTLLETALTGQDVPYCPIRGDDDLAFLDPNETRTILFKPYGSLDTPASLVVTEDEQLSVFSKKEDVVSRLQALIKQYALLLVGYAPSQDQVFVRIYHDARQKQPAYQHPAFAVQSLPKSDDAAAWEARGVTVVIEDPATFLGKLAEMVAQAQGRDLKLSALASLSKAPVLTPEELNIQASLLNGMMDQIGVADLVEQTNVPLLSAEQLRDIEAMRAAYERLMQNFGKERGAEHVWLRQGNLEYARGNYQRAEYYYMKALAVNPDSAAAYHNLHYACLERKDYPGAWKAYLQAVTLRPDLALVPERYRIDGVIGGGGIGVVYRAWDTQTDQPVAIKILRQSQAQTEHILEAFKREAHILQALDHPNIVRMLDFASHHGSYFIVMEFLDGETLKEALEKTHQPLALDAVFRIIEQTCSALSYAHAANLIHRDVKPSNIFLTSGQVKLIDFGLAKEVSAATSGTITGTPTYIAPEQAEGRGVDARTDEYAAATVFYETLSGVNPSQGTYQRLSELPLRTNGALDLVIEKARERAPEKRYPTVDAFYQELKYILALQEAARGQPVSRNAPLAARLVAQAANFIKTTFESLWWAWVGGCLLVGFAIPALWQAVTAVEIARYASLAVFIIWMLTVISTPFTMLLARRVRSAALAIYGSALGPLLGIANSILWLRGFSYETIKPEPRLGYAETQDFLLLITASVLLSLGTAVGVFLLSAAAGWLADRFRRNYAFGFYVIFGLLVIALLLAALFIPLVQFGSIGPET